jgi:cell division protein FtsN
MKDYKEPISRVQRRQQLKRLFVVMGGMVFAFAIFIGGVRVGIQVERERERIAQKAPSQPKSSEDKKATEGREKKETTPAPEKKDEKMKFTFYDTLTKKEGTEQATKKPEKTTAPSEKKTTKKKEAVKQPPAAATKDEETKKAPVEKDLYFVQIASFEEKETAEKMKDRLAQKGYKVQVVTVQLKGIGLRYRVRLGGYKNLQEALDAQTKVSVEEQITETIVVSEP